MIAFFSLFLSSFRYMLLLAFKSLFCEKHQFILTARIYHTSMQQVKLFSSCRLLQFLIPLSRSPGWASNYKFRSGFYVKPTILKNTSSEMRNIILISTLSDLTKAFNVATRGKFNTKQHFAIKVTLAQKDYRIFEFKRDVLFFVGLISDNEFEEVRNSSIAFLSYLLRVVLGKTRIDW